jgi:hypothetical protein
MKSDSDLKNAQMIQTYLMVTEVVILPKQCKQLSMNLKTRTSLSNKIYCNGMLSCHTSVVSL